VAPTTNCSAGTAFAGYAPHSIRGVTPVIGIRRASAGRLALDVGSALAGAVASIGVAVALVAVADGAAAAVAGVAVAGVAVALLAAAVLAARGAFGVVLGDRRRTLPGFLSALIDPKLSGAGGSRETAGDLRSEQGRRSAIGCSTSCLTDTRVARSGTHPIGVRIVDLLPV
jgi:hypothetical protein